jgi:hypothetical protein
MTPHANLITSWAQRRSPGDPAGAAVAASAVRDFLAWADTRGPPARMAMLDRILTGFGGPARLARAAHVTPATVTYWAKESVLPGRHWNGIIAAGARLDPPLLLTRDEFVSAYGRTIFGAAA